MLKNKAFEQKDTILMRLLTAKENLRFYIGMNELWLTDHIYETIGSKFLVD